MKLNYKIPGGKEKVVIVIETSNIKSIVRHAVDADFLDRLLGKVYSIEIDETAEYNCPVCINEHYYFPPQLFDEKELNDAIKALEPKPKASRKKGQSVDDETPDK